MSTHLEESLATIVDQWKAEETDVVEVSALEIALMRASAACVAAGEAAPCRSCGGRFAEQWDDVSWHCFDCKERLDDSRTVYEAAAKDAAVSIDAPYLQPGASGITVLSREGKEHHAQRGVSVAFLTSLLLSMPMSIRQSITTAQVVRHLVKPASLHRRCRFFELPAMRSWTGAPCAFVSHTWDAPFAELVAAIAHVIGEDEYVWLDVFAVRQWPGNAADLDFQCVIQEAPSFLLVCVHLPEVAALSLREAYDQKRIPATAKAMCAFYRVWCLVELSEAMQAGKNVVLLVGGCDETGSFVPNAGMLSNLRFSMDVQQASASVYADRKRILKQISDGIGFAAVNRFAVGAIVGANFSMDQPAVLKAVFGNPAPLAALTDFRSLVKALSAAAAGGFTIQVRELLSRMQQPWVNLMPHGHSPLMLASGGGHVECMVALIDKQANVNQTNSNGTTSLIYASMIGNDTSVRVLLDSNADVNKASSGFTALMAASQKGHLSTVRTLLQVRRTPAKQFLHRSL